MSDTPVLDAAAQPKLKSDQLFINLGPQHPSTHGVLRIGLTIEGEVIVKAVPDIGYLAGRRSRAPASPRS